MSAAATQNPAHPTVLSLAQLLQQQQPTRALPGRTGTVAAARHPVCGWGTQGR